jgi:hypothetical protein
MGQDGFMAVNESGRRRFILGWVCSPPALVPRRLSNVRDDGKPLQPISRLLHCGLGHRRSQREATCRLGMAGLMAR